MRKFQTALLTGILALVYSSAPAQTNDSCNNALLLTIGQTCDQVTYSNAGATGESDTVAPNPACGAYKGGDVWFKALVPPSGAFRTEIQGVSGPAPCSVIYSGSCGNFTQIVCNNGNDDITITDTALAGEYIFIRVFSYNNASGGTFNFCIWEPPVPANNNCADALPLAVGSSCQPATYSNAYSTPEPLSVAPNPGCGQYRGADVWFTATWPSSGVLRFQLTNGKEASVYSGSCGSFTELYCIEGDMSRTIIDTSLAGQPLYIRVWSWLSDAGGTFTICLAEPMLPVNNDCEDAIPLSVTGECQPESYSNEFSTPEPLSVAPNPGCGQYRGADVWFTATWPSSGVLRFQLTNGKDASVYSGSCGAFTELYCIDGDMSRTIIDTSLAGEPLYIRVWSWLTDEGSAFTICLAEPMLPVNNDCEDAIPLSVTGECQPESYSNEFSTPEPLSVAPNPGCGQYRGADVWFTATWPSSGVLRFQLTNGKDASVYSGSCGAFTELYCIDGDMSRTIIDTSLAGEPLYIRVWSWLTDEGGAFTICLAEPLLPVNNDCEDALPLVVDSTCQPENYSNEFSTPETLSIAPDPSCGNYRGADVWFTATWPSSGVLRFQLTNGKVASVYSGSCGAFTELYCIDGDMSRTIIDTSLAGEPLYIRVWSWLTDEGSAFTICLAEPELPVNNDCEDALPLVVGSTCQPENYTNEFSTPEPLSIAPDPSCGNYRGADVWFTAAMPLSGKLRIEVGNGKKAALYSGVCGSFTLLYCFDDDLTKTIYNPSLAGQNLYIRVWSWLSDEGGPFSICLWEPPIPGNDYCSDPDLLPVYNEYTPSSFSNAFATTEPVSVAPDPNCGYYKGGDVWFNITVPVTGNLIIKGSNVFGVNAHKAIYTGNCGNFTQIHCSAIAEIFSINNPALAGNTLTLRIFNWNNEEGGTFLLGAYDTTCNNRVAQIISDTITSGENYIFPDGTELQNITESLIDTSFFTAYDYCDSLIVTYLHVEPVLVSISGFVTYNNEASSPLGNAMVFLSAQSGDTVESTSTDMNGYYLFDSIPAGHYLIHTHISNPFGGINSGDALRILQHVVNMQVLHGMPYEAADVNMSGFISSADALLVAKRTVGLISSFNSGDWLTETLNLYVTSNMENQDIRALCFGDVNASYTPGNIRKPPSVSLLREGSIEMNPDRSVEIPVSLTHDLVTSAITLHIFYPQDQIEILGIETDLTDLLFHIKDGLISVAWYNLEPASFKSGQAIFSIRTRLVSGNDLQSDFDLSPGCEFAGENADPMENIIISIPKISENKSADEGIEYLSIYPNPVKGNCNIDVRVPKGTSLLLFLEDMLGNHLYMQHILDQDQNIQHIELNTGMFPNGIYLLRLANGQMPNTTLLSRKIIVIN